MHLKGGTYYYVTSTLPRKWIKLDADLKKAKQLWAKLEGLEATGAATYAAALDKWEMEYLPSLTAGTQKAYQSQIKVTRGAFGHQLLDEIKPIHLYAYLDAYPSKAQANMGVAIMSSVFVFAMRKGLCDRNPCGGIKKNPMKTRGRYITDEEFINIRENATDAVRVAMDIAYISAARLSDVLKITLQDIKPDGLLVIQQKTGKKQLFEMTPAIEAVIAAAKALPRNIRGMNLICTRSGKQYAPQSFRDQWDNACEAAGVEDAHFHDIRGKSATDAKKLGMDYQKLLGHSTRAMSDRYIKTLEIDVVTPMKRVK